MLLPSPPAGHRARRHKLGNDLGIGRRLAVVPAIGQLLLQLAKVFDHAVVHQRDDVIAADVRVGVRVGRWPVRGPPRVAEADLAAGRVRLQLLDQSSTRPADLVIANSPSSIVTTPLLS